MKGAAHAGVLVFMHERGLMRRATKFAGSSVGAVIAAACALRMDVREIVRLWSELDYVAMMTAGSGESERGKFGGRAMHEFFRGLIGRETGEPDMTFREMHRARGTTLVVAATCVSLRRCVYFTHSDDEYADMPVALALRMSCSLPFVLEPVTYKGLLFADGAITDALPLEALWGLGGPLKNTLAVVVMSADDHVGGFKRIDGPKGPSAPKGPGEREGPKGPSGAKEPDGSRKQEGPKGPEGPHGPTNYAAMLLESAMRSRVIRVPSDATARVLYVRTSAGCGITRVQNEDTGALVRRGYEEARSFFSL
jgi:predicted acylesterase/phospholipase RssA